VKEVVRPESIRQKSAYIAKYLNNYWTSLYHRFGVGRCI